MAAAACSGSTVTRLPRCGISMKGIDIVVRGSVGHMSAFMAQTGVSSSAATRATRSATRSTKPACMSRGSVASLGADCIEKELRDGARRSSSPTSSERQVSSKPPTRLTSGAMARHGQLYTFKIDNAGASLMPATDERPWNLRETYLFDRAVIAEIQRAAARGHLRNPWLRRETAAAAL